MAVHTKLTFEQIAQFLSNYPLGKLLGFAEIIDGIDNSNFLIKTEAGKFILTIFEERIKTDDLPFFMQLKLHLAHKGILCPKPIKNKDGALIGKLKNKSSSIVSFLNGAALKTDSHGYYYPNITKKHCFEVGKNLALLHNATLDFSMHRNNDLGVKKQRKLFEKITPQIEQYQNGLADEINDYLNFIEQHWRDDLPSGVAHLDFFPDNVFFNDNAIVSGIIDFYFAANDLFIYDLAIALSAWCCDENNSLDKDKFSALLQSYSSLKKISQDEMDFLNIALTAANMRFLLTRLYDYFFTPKNSLVKIKDPQEYLQKLRNIRVG